MTLTPRERQPGDLTARQRQVGRLILEGLTYPEIGTRLHLSTKTVETYATAIRYRLGVTNEDRHRRSELFAALRQYYADRERRLIEQEAT